MFTQEQIDRIMRLVERIESILDTNAAIAREMYNEEDMEDDE